MGCPRLGMWSDDFRAFQIQPLVASCWGICSSFFIYLHHASSNSLFCGSLRGVGFKEYSAGLRRGHRTSFACSGLHSKMSSPTIQKVADCVANVNLAYPRASRILSLQCLVAQSQNLWSRQPQWTHALIVPGRACTNRLSQKGQDPMYLRQSVQRVNTWPHSWCQVFSSVGHWSLLNLTYEGHRWSHHCVAASTTDWKLKAHCLCLGDAPGYALTLGVRWVGIGHSAEWPSTAIDQKRPGCTDVLLTRGTVGTSWDFGRIWFSPVLCSNYHLPAAIFTLWAAIRFR